MLHKSIKSKMSSVEAFSRTLSQSTQTPLQDKCNRNKKDRRWKPSQQQELISLHQKYGNKWKVITQKLHKKNPNDVKNKFNSIMRLKLRKLLKIMGKKHSSEIAQGIKPSVLSKAIFQGTNGEKNQLTNFLMQINEKQTNIQELQKSVLFQILDNIKAENQEYLKQRQEKKKPIEITQIASTVLQEREIKRSQKIESDQESREIIGQNFNFNLDGICQNCDFHLEPVFFSKRSSIEEFNNFQYFSSKSSKASPLKNMFAFTPTLGRSEDLSRLQNSLEFDKSEIFDEELDLLKARIEQRNKTSEQ